jgi:hypothetical protein
MGGQLGDGFSIERRMEGQGKADLFTCDCEPHFARIAAAIVFRLLLPYFFEFIPITKLSVILDAVIFSISLWLLFTVWGKTHTNLSEEQG